MGASEVSQCDQLICCNEGKETTGYNLFPIDKFCSHNHFLSPIENGWKFESPRCTLSASPLARPPHTFSPLTIFDVCQITFIAGH